MDKLHCLQLWSNLFVYINTSWSNLLQILLGWIRIRIYTVRCWIRIHIEKNSRIRIRKKWMRIRLNYYMDPDPGSRIPPYKSGSGSGSKEKTFSQNSIFQNFVEKSILSYWYRTATLYKIGEGPKRTAEVTEELQSSMRIAKVTGGQLRSDEVIWGGVRSQEFNWGDIL